jgi:hypothetical protein
MDREGYVNSLPVCRIACRVFTMLPEYSSSLPTGTKPGRMWRRLDGAHDLDWKAAGGKPRWMIGQYDPECPPEATSIRVLWFRPILMMVADVPHVMLKADMVVPARYGSADRKLRPDIIDWLDERGGRKVMRRFTGTTIEFYRRDDAFEFKMRFM